MKSVDALLLHCLSNDYLSITDYITRKPSTAWFLEVEIVTWVSSQADKLHYWCDKWNISEEHFKEANVIAEMKSGVLITRKQFPHLHEWFAIHVFSLPVHNALAERQFNIASLYLDPNMSEESNQVTQLFVQNVIHRKTNKKSLTRSTAKTRQEYIETMNEYPQTITANLISQAKINLADQKGGNAEHPAPLRKSQIAEDRWETLKERENVDDIIKNLQKQGRELEIKWQSSTLKDKHLEAERSFRPSFSEDIMCTKGNTNIVPSLRVICASTIR